MRQLWEDIKYTPYVSEVLKFFRKGDLVLLFLCLLTSGFGILCMISATQAEKFGGSMRYVLVQSAGIVLGLIMFAIISSIDVEVMSEHRNLLVAFNVFLLLMLIGCLQNHYQYKSEYLRSIHLLRSK